MKLSEHHAVRVFSWMLFTALLSQGCASEDDAAAPGEAVDLGAADVMDATMPVDGAGVPEDGTRPDAALDPALKFAFPIHPDDRQLMHPTLVFGVDHDPAEGNQAQCLNFDDQPFPLCYDGHDGSDFILAGGFEEMDRGSARVVAAAAGEVYRVVDGQYDRCHGDWAVGDISCDGHPIRANHVRIRHGNGWTSWYYHLKQDSVRVSVGDFVACGDVLGLVGSSGRSYLPHLHFEVESAEGANIDPFGGALTNETSHWMEQVGPDQLPGPDCHPLWTTP